MDYIQIKSCLNYEYMQQTYFQWNTRAMEKLGLNVINIFSKGKKQTYEVIVQIGRTITECILYIAKTNLNNNINLEAAKFII